MNTIQHKKSVELTLVVPQLGLLALPFIRTTTIRPRRYVAILFGINPNSIQKNTLLYISPQRLSLYAFLMITNFARI